MDLVIPTVFLLVIALLIPQPNPRDQKRRIKIRKLFYFILIFMAAYVFSKRLIFLDLVSGEVLQITCDWEMIACSSFFVFVVYVLFMRRHVR